MEVILHRKNGEVIEEGEKIKIPIEIQIRLVEQLTGKKVKRG